MTNRIATGLLVFCAVSSTAQGGTILELRTTEYSQDPPIIGAVEISTQDRLSRIEITSVSSNESGSIIYRSDEKELIALDHSAGEYYVIDQPTIDRMAAQVRATMAQMDAALASMPPEERALAEQMMQRHLPQDGESEPPPKLKLTGEKDKVAGFTCKYYDVVQDDRKIRDICVTRWSEIAEGREAAQAMMALADFFENMRKAFSGAGGMDVMDEQQEMFAYMKELDGYPVLAREYDVDGVLESESRLVAARNEPISPSVFEAPATYLQHPLQ
jgi:hypothetical protein